MTRILMEVFERTVPLGAAVRAGARDAEQKAAWASAEAMRSLVPVDTGALRDSIFPQQMRDAGGRFTSDMREEGGVVSAGDDGDVDYAGFVEFGTVRTPAQPFFYQGLEAGNEEFMRVAGEVINFSGVGW